MILIYFSFYVFHVQILLCPAISILFLSTFWFNSLSFSRLVSFSITVPHQYPYQYSCTSFVSSSMNSLLLLLHNLFVTSNIYFKSTLLLVLEFFFSPPIKFTKSIPLHSYSLISFCGLGLHCLSKIYLFHGSLLCFISNYYLLSCQLIT